MADKILTFNGKTISGPSGTGMIILDIPELPEPEAMTLRFQFSDKSYDPTGVTSKGTWTKVQHPFSNIWDWTYNEATWREAFYNKFTSPDNIVDIIDAGDTSGVTSLYRTFSGGADSSYVHYIRSFCLFDTSNVTNMKETFVNCIMESVPEYDTSNVTNMVSMFQGCENLKRLPLFNTSKVTGMAQMLADCNNLEEVPLFDTSSVSSMSAMLLSCYKLRNIPKFNTSSVTNMLGMLNGDIGISTIPNFDYSNVTSTNRFISCSTEQSPKQLETISNISTLTSKLNDCTKMFSGQTEVKYGILDAYNKLISCNPTTYDMCFANCGINTLEGHYQLNQIPTSWGGLLDSNHTVTIGDRVYRTITIGTQEWMVENLELDIEGSVWYNNDPTMKDKGYGKLYTVDMYNSFTPPTGWKKPDVSDFKTLQTYTQANNIDMRSIIGWSTVSPSDSIGFYGIPNGYCADTGNFFGIGAETSYWAGNRGHIARLTGIYDGAPFQALGMLVSRPGYYQTIRLVRDLA